MKSRTMLSGHHFNVWVGLLLLILLTPLKAFTSPITITQHYGPINEPLGFIGGSTTFTVTGDWILKITTNTDSPDLDPSTSAGLFNAEVTVTNSGLGLDNVKVLNYHYYWEWEEPGYTASGLTVDSFHGGWGLEVATGAVGDPNVIEPLYLDFTALNSFVLFSKAPPLQLENGMEIASFSLINLEDGYQSSGVPVPEPSTLLLISFGLGGLIGVRKKLSS